MKKHIWVALLSFLGMGSVWAQGTKPDTLWYRYENRFVANDYLSLEGVDSVSFSKSSLKRHKTDPVTGRVSTLNKTYGVEPGRYYLTAPERFLAQTDTYASCDFTRESSQFCFQRSRESEHFVIFWENGLTMNSTGKITYGGYTVDVFQMLRDAERIWKVNVEDLGFITPGQSTTDQVKIEMFIVKTSWDGSDWRADGSGTEATYYEYRAGTKQTKRTKVGVFHCTTRAASARNGHTLAHEIGHTFQYLVGADSNGAHGLGWGLGQGSDNQWWEDCANWQAYKVYPHMQYSDGEYYEAYLRTHHLNIHHEDVRYNSCFYQDYWCQLHGANTVARIWREADARIKEDPTHTYMRIFGLDEASFGNEMYETYAHLTSLDIQGIHSNSQAKVGMEPQRLMGPTPDFCTNYLDGDKQYWVVDPKYCPQNYGYNANPLKIPAEGSRVTAHFRGLVGAEGYASVNPAYAGWRYGLVALAADGSRTYSETGADKQGQVSLVVPKECTHLWFVVMGAPTKYWSHSWTRGVDPSSYAGNGEQWPYAVKFEGTDPLGVSRTYEEYPADYARHDTTVVVNVNLPYSSSSYSYVTVPYDMDAISQALGLSTAQLKSVKRNDATSHPGDIRFAGVSANGISRFTTTTTDSNEQCYGHWFTTTGSVCEWGGSSAVYANFFPATYRCNVGQKPGVLLRGRTYVIRQSIVYTHTDRKMYKAVIEVHVKIV